MSDDANDAGQAGGEETTIVQAPDNAPKSTGLSEAARILASARQRKSQEESPAAQNDAARAAMQQSEAAPADDSDPPQAAPAETPEAKPEPEAELPPIEPPRSWKAEEKERFRALPRETQEYLTERETERDRSLRQSQNDAATKLKELEAREQAAEQVRQQYESALPQLLQQVQASAGAEFSDIRTMADVERLAREDWPRYLQWDLAQKKMAALGQEITAAKERQQQEKLQKFADFAKREDSRFAELVPEMADSEKAAKLQRQALSVLHDVGYTDDELSASWRGDKDLSLRDHRIQLLIRDASAWREAQQRRATVVAKPVPPVAKPGVPQSREAVREAEIAAMSKNLESASGLNALRLAAELTKARREARR